MSYGGLRNPVSSWPVPIQEFEPKQALRARDACFADYELADELGFDWVSLAKHQHSPNSRAPSLAARRAAPTNRDWSCRNDVSAHERPGRRGAGRHDPLFVHQPADFTVSSHPLTKRGLN
jgi:hypothetical protein